MRFLEGGVIIKHSENEKQGNIVDYLILLFIISLAFYMFSNTKTRVNSNSYDEYGEQFPFINNINYIEGEKNVETLNNLVYLNNEKQYFIKISFNKELIVSENAKLRVLFNNNTYIERSLSSGKYNHIEVEGDNTIHFENELKVVDVEVINGYIKDEHDHELNTTLNDEIIDNQTGFYIWNKLPEFEAYSAKSFYTDDVASVIIKTDKKIIESYCISESDICLDNNYVEYTNSEVQYKFSTDKNDKQLCVFVKDKAGNVSNCKLVKFNYYPFPMFELSVKEGNIVNSNSININIELGDNNYINLTKYCVYTGKEECIKKDLISSIDELKELSNQEGIHKIYFVLFDDHGYEFKYEHTILLDKTKPTLEYTITNQDTITNYKYISINYTDDNELSNENLYEYYLSTSDKLPTNSSWIKYENNKTFRIRNVKDGDYYLWIRNIKDTAGNFYSNDEYILISEKLSFDNSKPIINISTTPDDISENNLTKEFIITYNDNSKLKDAILDDSSVIVNCTSDVIYKITIKKEIDNGWIVEVNFNKESLTSGYFTLTILSNLVEDIAGNRNDETNSQLIKIK